MRLFLISVLTFCFCNQCIALVANSRIDQAKEFCKKHQLDTQVIVFVNMQRHSGKNRLFVYHSDSGRVIKKGLCSHGSCSGRGNLADGEGYSQVVFSNQEGSYCSSLGKYKIGKRGWSNYGIHVNYKLHGLESTNDNAYDRIIVLHSFEMVPDNEVYPEYIVTSLGCPMVSDNMMRYLDDLLKERNKPVLLWIYD